MHNSLANETVIITGTAKTQSVQQQIEARGGQVLYLPLIATKERITPQDEWYVQQLHTFDWLIFTSQNAVDAFAAKCARLQQQTTSISCFVAAVGTKTKAALEAIGMTVHFVPSVFSADVFIEEFPAFVKGQPRCLFCKGNLAKNTIEQLPFPVQSWIVYDTVEHEKNAQQLRALLQTTRRAMVVFASPSAVRTYTQSVLPDIAWEQVRVASIGHITTAALQQAGARNILQPATYTMQAVTELIIQQSEGTYMTNLQFKRHRRLRHNAAMRALVKETHLHVEDFIYPIFVAEGEGIKNPINSMPGVYQFSLDTFEQELKEVVELGIQAVILFGLPAEKDAEGTGAFHDHGIIQKATRRAKELYPDLLVVADTCLCEYTDHGHCGVVEGEQVLNDPSLDLLARTAVSQAKAGADIIAPSNMMDGFVIAIREALDAAGFAHIPIMSYAVKYASSYYGPFREAADGAPQFGDRKTYQMDPSNRQEAFREAQSDVEEGADFLIVKPALAYLDIIRDMKNTHPLPIVAYNVSGEYAMVKAAAQNGWIDEKAVVLETLLGMKRAGSDLIITYHAKDAARWLKGE